MKPNLCANERTQPEAITSSVSLEGFGGFPSCQAESNPAIEEPAPKEHQEEATALALVAT